MASTPGSEVNVAEDRPSPADEVQRLYNEAETQMARAMEDLVSRDSFGSLLVRMTENVMGVTQIATGAIDLVVRNLRIAGRPGRHPARAADRTDRGQAGAGPAGGRAARRAARGPEAPGPAHRHQRRHHVRAAPQDERLTAMAPTLAQIARAPVAAIDFANILLTTQDATIGASPKDVVWTHRTTTLYRYRSNLRTKPVPVLLVFALINRPDIFDLRPGNSFVEYLLDEGYDVFLVDWGAPGDEDRDVGLDSYVCDALPWAMREVLRESGQDELSLVGWCIGGALAAMHAAIDPASPARNLVLLTTPVDTSGSLYAKWVGRPDFDAGYVADTLGVIPGAGVDVMNKMMKPVTNFWTTYRTLWSQVLEGTARREAYQTMAKWVADNPPFAGRAYREWIEAMYQRNQLVAGTMRLRGERVDLRNIEQNLLVVTAGADHIAPRHGTLPLLDLVSSADVEHLDRPGGHIGLMAGSRARTDIWPEIAGWLAERSDS